MCTTNRGGTNNVKALGGTTIRLMLSWSPRSSIASPRIMKHSKANYLKGPSRSGGNKLYPDTHVPMSFLSVQRFGRTGSFLNIFFGKKNAITANTLVITLLLLFPLVFCEFLFWRPTVRDLMTRRCQIS